MRFGKYCRTIIATVAGLGLAVILVLSTDVTTLRASVSRVGLAAPVVIAVRLGVVALAGLGWAQLVIASRRASLTVLVGLRFVREAVNVLLPVTAVGGDVVGGRLLTQWSVPPGAAAASILGDLTVLFFTQLLFAALGTVVLAVSGKSRVVVVWASSAVGIGALALIGLFAVQRLGFFRLTEVSLDWFARRWPAASLLNPVPLHETLRVTYARPRKVTLSIGLHLVAWFLGTVESFAVLVAIGATPSLAAALVVESLGQAIRTSASPIPGALGVQEGGYILLVGLYGMSPETGLTLSLTKRIPDLLIGMTGLIAWLGLESGHIAQPMSDRLQNWKPPISSQASAQRPPQADRRDLDGRPRCSSSQLTELLAKVALASEGIVPRTGNPGTLDVVIINVGATTMLFRLRRYAMFGYLDRSPIAVTQA